MPTEPQYRIIADKDSTPDLVSVNAAPGDRLVYDVIDADRWSLVRIERPVLNSKPASSAVPENWDQIKQVSVLLAHIADPDSTVTVTEFAQAEAVIKYLNVQPPTRDQIDAAVGGVLFNASNYPRPAVPHIAGRDIGPLRAKVTDAVAALFGQ